MKAKFLLSPVFALSLLAGCSSESSSIPKPENNKINASPTIEPTQSAPPKIDPKIADPNEKYLSCSAYTGVTYLAGGRYMNDPDLKEAGDFYARKVSEIYGANASPLARERAAQIRKDMDLAMTVAGICVDAYFKFEKR